jgi:serine/threonine protein kinase
LSYYFDCSSQLLDFCPNISSRRLHVAALIRLSKASGLYPKCLLLTGIEFVGDCAIDGGGFGDVWKGRFRDHFIAMKILKVYVKSDINELLKVSSNSWPSIEQEIHQHSQQFSCEAVIWQQLLHPNILPFYGVYHLPNHGLRVCLVSPWMENGNLCRFLKDFPDTNRILLVRQIHNLFIVALY